MRVKHSAIAEILQRQLWQSALINDIQEELDALWEAEAKFMALNSPLAVVNGSFAWSNSYIPETNFLE